MQNRSAAEQIIESHGYEYKWLAATNVQVQQWVRFKCMFGCPSYGQKATCPPAVPTVAECREFFNEYKNIMVLRIPARLTDLKEHAEWSCLEHLKLLSIEQEIYRAGYSRAFLLTMDKCQLCEECPGSREKCTGEGKSRPSPEALGVDVFAAVEAAGFKREKIEDYSKGYYRYAFMLID
jgi:predicted metal-binding protein